MACPSKSWQASISPSLMEAKRRSAMDSELGESRAAMIVGDDELRSGPGDLEGLAFFTATHEEAERHA